MFCFLITFLYYRKSLSPCFGDNTTNVKTNKKFLFLVLFPHRRSFETLYLESQTILVLIPTQYQHFRSLCHRSMGIYAVQKSRQRILRQCFQLQHSYEYNNWNSFKNRSKWASAEMYFKRFSTELPLLRTHIGGCFKLFVKQLLVEYSQNIQQSKRDGVLLKQSYAKIQKKVLFQNALCVSLFRLF